MATGGTTSGWKVAYWRPSAIKVVRSATGIAAVLFGFAAALVAPPLYEVAVTDGWTLFLSEVGDSSWQLIILGGLALSWVVFVAMARRLEHQSQLTQIDHALLIGQFEAIGRRISDGLTLPRGKREADREFVLQRILDTFLMASKDLHDARAVFYKLNDAMTELTEAGKAGSRPTSGRFTKGADARGDSALDFVTSKNVGYSELVRDTQKETRPGYAGSGNGYLTYISTVVGNASGPIGMLTLDAGEPGDLTNADKRYASLAASLIAIAYTPVR